MVQTCGGCVGFYTAFISLDDYQMGGKHCLCAVSLTGSVCGRISLTALSLQIAWCSFSACVYLAPVLPFSNVLVYLLSLFVYVVGVGLASWLTFVNMHLNITLLLKYGFVFFTNTCFLFETDNLVNQILKNIVIFDVCIGKPAFLCILYPKHV